MTKMTKKNKNISFKTIEEYHVYYRLNVSRNMPTKNKYYKIGQDIARTAYKKAVAKLSEKTDDR